MHNYINTAAAAKSLQSCPTLCDPIDGSPPGSPVPGILQARTLEWVAISFSNAWKWEVKVKSLSHVRLLVSPWTAAHQAPPKLDFPGKSNMLSRYYLIFTSLCFQSKHYCLHFVCATLCDSMDCSLPGSSAHGIFQARILEWVAISFSRFTFYRWVNMAWEDKSLIPHSHSYEFKSQI